MSVHSQMFLMRNNGVCGCLLMIVISGSGIAQDSIPHPSLSITFYADAYAAYYTDSLEIDAYQKFPSVSPRSQQLGLNVAMLTAKYSSSRARGTITLHYGDVPLSAWS